MGNPPYNIAPLLQGQPPEDTECLQAMTVGRELWLDRFREYHLENYIRYGGSKVKILVGGEGTGKTHLLRCVAEDAQKLNYTVVFLNLPKLERPLSNIVEFYKAVAAQVDCEDLTRGLCRRVAEQLGYSRDEYDGSDNILGLFRRDGTELNLGKRHLREAASEAFRSGDLSLPFFTLACTLVSERMLNGSSTKLEACWKWLAGEKLETAERKATYLYDRLNKANARVWLYSLIRLLRLSGKAGVVVLIDNIEVLLKRSHEGSPSIYTATAVRDTHELIRQLIDDVELLEHFVLLLSGRPEVLTDEIRGFRSYEALWMRLETGLARSDHFNPWADIIDVDRHLEAGGADFPEKVSKGLLQFLQSRPILPVTDQASRDSPSPSPSPLRRAVIETARSILDGR